MLCCLRQRRVDGGNDKGILYPGWGKEFLGGIMVLLPRNW